MKVVIDALGTVTKGLAKRLEDLEIRGQVETTQTTALLRSTRILRRVLETWGALLSLKLQWKTIGLRCREKLSKEYDNNDNNNNDNNYWSLTKIQMVDAQTWIHPSEWDI